MIKWTPATNRLEIIGAGLAGLPGWTDVTIKINTDFTYKYLSFIIVEITYLNQLAFSSDKVGLLKLLNFFQLNQSDQQNSNRSDLMRIATYLYFLRVELLVLVTTLSIKYLDEIMLV